MTPTVQEPRTHTRVAGHALSNLAYRPHVGWAWECQCAYRPIAYADTAAIARTEHREHKARLGTLAEHATVQIWPTTSGLQARCICGHLLGASQSMDSTRAAHETHQHENPMPH